PTMCTTDSNLHSTIWNPEHSSTHDKNADKLYELMTKYNLCLRSPLGIPTFGLGFAHTQGTSIDLTWVNEGFDDSIVLCTIDQELEKEKSLYSHFSDHEALIT
ncbi:hypothetical protein CROQUDRAFT_8030, partial [Cronartium quercuum f. sp. fusiforme G11]